MKPKARLQNSLFKRLPRRTRRRLFKDFKNGTLGSFAADILTTSLSDNATYCNPPAADANSARPGFEFFEESLDFNEEDSFCENVNLNPAVNARAFIHPDCELSPEESSVLIAAFAFKHGLTKAGTEDLLALLKLHMPKGAVMPSSYYCLMKDLNVDTDACTTHYVCPQCKAYVHLEDDVCEDCSFKINISDLKANNNYFFTFNPGFLLKAILKCPSNAENLAKNLKRRNANKDGKIADIVDGSFYKTLKLQDCDFTCSMNTDGVSPFRSSKFSITPVLISINELDYNLRRSNTALIGLWFSSEKPNYNSFLKPIVEDCNALSASPIEWHANNTQFLSFVYFPIFVADSVARCAVQGLNQFNGAFGCPWCNQKGETCWITPTKHKWIYPPTNIMENRTEESFVASLEILGGFWQNGEVRRKHVNGIKNASALLMLKHFHIIDSFVYDVMHSAFLGVSKMFTLLWTESSNSNAPYYIGNKVKHIDKALHQCKVPYEFDRTMRPFSTVKHWKASEWRSWTFLCCSITKGVLPDVYRNHFLKFANSIMLLCDENITEQDLLYTQEQLKLFVFQAKNLYGLKCCTFNLHILLHATSCVKKWGPLWAYSAFQYENFNGILTGMFRSSRNVIAQIRSRYLEFITIKLDGMKKILNPVALEYFNSLLSSQRFVSVAMKTNTGCVFLGPSRIYEFSDEEKLKLSQNGIYCQQGRSFRKCIIYGKVFSTEDNATTRRHNAIVATTDNKFYVIKKLVFAEFCQNKEGYAIVSRVNVCYPEPANSYLVSVRSIDSRLDIINVTSIQRQKFFTLFGIRSDLKFLIRLPNIVELE